MPLIIPKDLLGKDVLKREKIFTISENVAVKQDIRPIQIALVNLMPKKEETEIQFLRMLSNSALQINIDLVRMGSYDAKNTSKAHLEKFYKTYDEIKHNKYDAMIITGAPVETLEYESVKYWDELNNIFDFAKENVYSTMFVCWSAQAALYHYYNIGNGMKNEKIFGVYNYEKLGDNNILKGFDDEFYIPQSRYTYVNKDEFDNYEELQVLASREDTGVSIVTTKDNRFVFSFGHWEYDKETLHNEYIRDLNKSLKTAPPRNYYKDDNPSNSIKVKWRSAGNLFFSNWLNYCVYQETPFHIEDIEKKSVSKFGGSSLSDAKQFNKVKKIILSKDYRDIIVVSAPGKRNYEDSKVTDKLIEIHKLKTDILELKKVRKKIEAELNKRYIELEESSNTTKERFDNIAKDLNIYDEFSHEIENVFEEIIQSQDKEFIISRGEYLNAKIMAKYLKYDFIDAKELIFFDDKGNVDYELSNRNIKNNIKAGIKVVVPGFYGRDQSGKIKTFDRGGSDFTGSIIAGALHSQVYENWTDVDGIMTSDPRKNVHAKRIPSMNYSQLTRIIDEGAEVYQKEAIFPIKEKNIPLKILNTNNPYDEGTEVRD
ncbi:MAG: homoserine O-succinyltransferase [Tissierellia bacterium]|nr:homoserine O-succinyltransferase [Tissierellia bacterium]